MHEMEKVLITIFIICRIANYSALEPKNFAEYQKASPYKSIKSITILLTLIERLARTFC